MTIKCPYCGKHYDRNFHETCPHCKDLGNC